MKIEITPKIRQEFNKNWKEVTANSAYLIPETIDDFKSLGPFPYFQIEHIWVYPKDHTSDAIRHLTKLIYKIVEENLFSWPTVYSAIRDEIKLFFTTEPKHNNDWHLNHLLESILDKSKKRIFIRSISGLRIEGFEEVRRDTWQIILFTQNEIDRFGSLETGDEEWRSHVREYLAKNYKDKVCLLVEAEGDLETAKRKAHSIALFIVNTLRYFICIHISHTGRVHDVGIILDEPVISHGLNAFSFDLEKNTSTMFDYGTKFKQKYLLTKEDLDTIKSDWSAEKLWGLYEKDEPNDLEASILSSISWLGDAHQEMDINSSYVKYWIAIEALLTGHKKDGISARIKSTIPIMISQCSQDLPSKTEVDKAYELRCKVVHCGKQDMIKSNDINKICAWTTQCLSICINLLDRGYTSRDQIEFQINTMNNYK